MTSTDRSETSVDCYPDCEWPEGDCECLVRRIAELEAENGMLRAFSEGAWKAIRLLVASPSMKERAEIASELEALDAD